MKRLNKSVGFALNGLRSCFKQEPNFKIHSVVAVLVIAAGIYFKVSNIEWIVIVISIAAVLAAELFNTGIEELCNIVHKQEHPGIKFIKDVSAAAVLIVAIASIISGIFIFLPKILSFIK